MQEDLVMKQYNMNVIIWAKNGPILAFRGRELEVRM
jgi:hypothetical protein